MQIYLSPEELSILQGTPLLNQMRDMGSEIYICFREDSSATELLAGTEAARSARLHSYLQQVKRNLEPYDQYISFILAIAFGIITEVGSSILSPQITMLFTGTFLFLLVVLLIVAAYDTFRELPRVES